MTDDIQVANIPEKEENSASKSIYALFGTDSSMEQSGIWLEYGEFGRFLVARAGGSNSRFTKSMERLSRPHRRQIQNETLDESIANELLLKAFAESVILRWEGITDSDGKDLPFTRDNVIKLFKDLPDLFIDIREQAAKAANFQAAEVEGDLKNS